MGKLKDLTVSEDCQNNENMASPRPVANCDQEAWVLDRIKTAINMALSLRDNRKVQADDPLYASAIKGVINGTAFEIIKTLGMEPEGTNINNPYHWRPPAP